MFGLGTRRKRRREESKRERDAECGELPTGLAFADFALILCRCHFLYPLYFLVRCAAGNREDREVRESKRSGWLRGGKGVELHFLLHRERLFYLCPHRQNSAGLPFLRIFHPYRSTQSSGY